MIAKLSRKDIKMLESSAKNNVSKGALEEYLSAHKKAETAWKVFRDSLVLSEGSSENNASKEVKSEKKRKFKTGDKVRVLSEIGYVESGTLEEGSLTEVVYYKEDDNEFLFPYYNPVGVRNLMGEIIHCKESALELVTEEEKSSNELRAEIIQRAKEFIEDLMSGLVLGESIQFIEYRDKRRVVARRTVFATLIGIKGATTHPDDVYNFHIGKAIAIGRLLDKDVTEFENAVQPTKVVQGQVIAWRLDEEKALYRIDNKTGIQFNFTEVKSNEKHHNYEYQEIEKYTNIVDDTKAQYGTDNE